MRWWWRRLRRWGSLQVLSQIWSIVSQLQTKAAPGLAEERPSPASTATTGQAEDGGELNVGGGGGGGGGEGRQREPLASTLLVTPRLHPFNAAEFENFGRNLEIALKQTPIMDRIEVEVSGIFSYVLLLCLPSNNQCICGINVNADHSMPSPASRKRTKTRR